MDLYSMLYQPVSRPGHLWQVLAGDLGKSAKTVKRRVTSLGQARKLDVAFWIKNGFLNDDDWRHLKSTARQLSSFVGASFDELPDYVRELHPALLGPAMFFHSFKIEAAQDAGQPPLLTAMLDYAVDHLRGLSNIYFSLLNKNAGQYDQHSRALRLPFPFPAEDVWRDYGADGEMPQALSTFLRELVLLGFLGFDLAWLTWDLGFKRKGASALIGGCQALAKNPDRNCRQIFFDDLKKLSAQSRGLTGRLSNQKFYRLLAGDNDGEMEAVRKQCARIRRARQPSPKDLDLFLDRFLAIQGPASQGERVGYRNLFAHCLVLEQVLVDAVKKGWYASYDDLLSRLHYYRQWLFTEVFRCPIDFSTAEERMP